MFFQDPEMRPNRARERPDLREVPRSPQRPGAALRALPPPLHADHRRQTPPRQLLPHRLTAQVYADGIKEG